MSQTGCVELASTCRSCGGPREDNDTAHCRQGYCRSCWEAQWKPKMSGGSPPMDEGNLNEWPIAGKEGQP